MEMASTSSVSRNFPTLRYLAAPFRWFFRSRRRVLTVAAVPARSMTSIWAAAASSRGALPWTWTSMMRYFVW
jgi:hypothetical protein